MAKWFKVEDSFITHPKVRMLAQRLEINTVEARGYLTTLWCAAQTWTDAGVFGDVSDAHIAALAEWTGDPSDFVRALSDSGLIDKTNRDQWCVHDWEKYCPQEKDRQRQRLERRKRKRKKPNDLEKRPWTQHGRTSDRPSDVTDPSLPPPMKDILTPSHPQPTADLQNSSSTLSNSSTPKDTSSCAEFKLGTACAPARESVNFPVFLTRGIPGVWTLTPEQVNTWAESYQLSREQALALCMRAWSWLNDNPSRRKTARGMPKFLGGWISRAIDRGQIPKVTKSNGRPEVIHDKPKNRREAMRDELKAKADELRRQGR